MTDVKHTKDVYNKFGSVYHEKRQIPRNNYYNLYVEMPAMLKILKNQVKNKKVLDLGCGSGIFTKKLKQLGARVVGLDLSKSLIDIAIRENPKIDFYVADSRKTQFNNSQFDIISSSLMIHYLKNLDPVFKEANRILKKNGHFVFSFHHPFGEVIEKKKSKQQKFNIVKSYFHNDKYTWKMGEGIEMISYHHTFENISKSLFKNGFVINQIIEPKAITKGKNLNSKAFEVTNRLPSFCVIEVIKI